MDHSLIDVMAGDGGSGVVSFAHRKGGGKLGPDGGHGGAGGDVWLEASSALTTLRKVNSQRLYKAAHGKPGSSQHKTGACGQDRVITVPCGTEVLLADAPARPLPRIDPATPPRELRMLGCLDRPGQRLLVAKGGKRGLGNSAFVSATEQRPMVALPGSKGQRRTLSLKLKLLAHIGLAGYPNAGKSTLLRGLSRAKPKVADYPFTTIHPHLGVMASSPRDDQEQPWVIADIPGLLEGAAQGRGLGDEFLCHLEKTAVLVLVIRAAAAAEVLRQKVILEITLAEYSEELGDKLKLVFIAQSDRLSAHAREELRSALGEQVGDDFVLGSVHTGEGMVELRAALAALMQQHVTSATTPPPRGESARAHHQADEYVTDLLNPEMKVLIRQQRGKALSREV